jgi:hypothetical protein
MSESEWFACDQPDLLLEVVETKASRKQLVEFVRQCWDRIADRLPPLQTDFTVVEQFAKLADQQSDHDAVLYAAEAALKAAGWASDIREEQKQQASLLRHIVGSPF